MEGRAIVLPPPPPSFHDWPSLQMILQLVGGFPQSPGAQPFHDISQHLCSVPYVHSPLTHTTGVASQLSRLKQQIDFQEPSCGL